MLRRVADMLLCLAYGGGAVITAFDVVSRGAWTDWWRKRWPAAVAMWERLPGATRDRARVAWLAEGGPEEVRPIGGKGRDEC